jgi:hypothetical protein
MQDALLAVRIAMPSDASGLASLHVAGLGGEPSGNRGPSWLLALALLSLHLWPWPLSRARNPPASGRPERFVVGFLTRPTCETKTEKAGAA